STAKGLLGTKPVKLQSDLLDPMPEIWADESRLRQVLLNLYSNACKYTDEGSIKLTVSRLSESNEIQFALADTGIGIDPEFHAKLFEEFQQAKAGGRDPRSGSGLGLAISRQLLELMDGRIWMESTPSEGSTFYFTVQVYDNQSKPATESSQVVKLVTLQPQAQEVIKQ
ncbi:MAG: ATP-binding protein, partial [Chloroflexota bacterium]